MRRHVPWHVRSALVTVFRDLCVARSGAGSRNTFTWSRLGRAVGASPDGPKRRTPTARYPITTRSLLPGGHRAGSLRGARTPVVCARGGHARDRGAVATSSARGGFWASTRATRSLGTLARATGELQLAIAPELLALLLALYATNRYEHIICY